MYNVFLRKAPNADYVTHLLLKDLRVAYNYKSITTNLNTHPEYPSLLSISDCLNEWNIPNQSYQINKEDYDPTDLFFPFIAHFTENGGRYVLIHAIEGPQVIYSDEKHNEASLPQTEFLKRWDGIALHAEVTATSGEINYSQNKLKYFLANLVLPLGCVLFIMGLYLALSNQVINPAFTMLAFVKVLGLAVTVLLLIQSINSNNPFVQNLCGLAGKNDCNAILKSDVAKLTNWLSWSEVGFFYFAGSLLSLLLAPSSLFILAWLNLLALPYTVYSISYQYRTKNWCILCCAVQVLLLLEFLVNFFSIGYQLPVWSFNLLVRFEFAFALPVFIWAFLKPYFTKEAQLKPLQQQLKKFKYNTGLFNQALTNQPRYAVSNELMPIVLGNPEAETVITMVSNPFCGPCAKAHETLDEWLKSRDDIQLKIIFTTANHHDDARTKVARHITALSLLDDKKNVEEALNNWYKQSAKKYEDWAAKYPVSFNGDMVVVTENQKKWCDMAEIKFTPTILINGYKLPEPYRLEDIKYLIK